MKKIIFKLDDDSEIAIAENHVISFAYDPNNVKFIISFTGHERGISSDNCKNKEAYDKFVAVAVAEGE